MIKSTQNRLPAAENVVDFSGFNPFFLGLLQVMTRQTPQNRGVG